MTQKVVQGDDMFFKDDIQIIDMEIATPLSMPSPIPILSRDEMQIFYNGHVFVATKKKTKDAQVKIYTQTFGLEEVDAPKKQEDKYFSDNQTLIDKLKADFIERSVNGVSVSDSTIKGILGPTISSELVEKITREYSSVTPSGKHHTPPGKGLVTRNNDGSVFNTHVKGCERLLILEEKAYSLSTLAEYISKFEKSFKPSFYLQVQKKCQSMNTTPEEIAELLTKNADTIHRKALPMVRNKIWFSKRSFKLHLDDNYWVPEFEGKTDKLRSIYEKLLERQVKIDAAKAYV
jgi:hypothetical protein